MTQLDCFPLPRGPAGEGVGRVGGWAITSYFGGRPNPFTGQPSYHGGEDISGATINLQPFYAVKSGDVVQGWDPGGGGNWTTLYTDEGPRFGYGHASSFAPGVNGTHVAAGTLLGHIGSTGASTGPHLHFAYGSSRGSVYGDPFDLLQECAAAGRFHGETPTPTPPIPTDWFDMATKADLEDVLVELATSNTEKAQKFQWGMARSIVGVMCDEDLTGKTRPTHTLNEIGDQLIQEGEGTVRGKVGATLNEAHAVAAKEGVATF